MSFNDPNLFSDQHEHTRKQGQGLQLSTEEESKYLQLPKSLRKELRTYVQSVLESQNMELTLVKRPIELARLLSGHLKSKFTYRLDQSLAQSDLDFQAGNLQSDLDPILYFLQHSKAGHCEYFSTALTLLLRSVVFYSSSYGLCRRRVE